MEKEFFLLRIIFLFLLCGSFTSSYKKDHGFGYLFKHDPNFKERERVQKLTNDLIRNAFGGGSAGNGTLFPQPYQVPDMQIKFSGTTLSFTGIRVYGLERFRPLEIQSDYSNLALSVKLSMDDVRTVGNFQWMGSSQGNFAYTISDAWLIFEAEIEMLNEGTVMERFTLGRITDVRLAYDSLHLSFDIPAFFNTLLQPMKGPIGRNLFTQLKPVLARDAEQNFGRVIRSVFEKLPNDSSEAVNLVDRALRKARKAMKSADLDPLFITDHYPKSSKIIKLELTQGSLEGLSNIKRIEPIFVAFERDAVHMTLNFGVQNLKGQYTYTWVLWKHLLTHRGILRFNVNDITIQAKLEKRFNAQYNGTRVSNITMNIGSVNLISDGLGAAKYIMETFLNVVPDTFRLRIMESAEHRLLTVIEEEVGKIDLEEIVDDESNSVEVNSP